MTSPTAAPSRISGRDEDTAPLCLDTFIPYRLSVLSNQISRSVAALYAERFGLTIPEWRVMAVLGLEETQRESVCANTVAERTEMDKVQVSRAIARMTQAELVTRTPDRADRRRAVLALTVKGRAVYREIVPAALEYEAALLGTLSASERTALDHLIAKLSRAARDLGPARQTSREEGDS